MFMLICVLQNMSFHYYWHMFRYVEESFDKYQKFLFTKEGSDACSASDKHCKGLKTFGDKRGNK